MELLRYIIHTHKHSDMRALLFPLGGLAIERRRKRFAKYWNPHLERCKNIQKKWAKELSNENLFILGAGRLYDVNRQALAKVSSTISLFDGDPLCSPFWKRFESEHNNECNFNSYIEDITETLSAWLQNLNQFIASSKCDAKENHFQQVLDFLQRTSISTKPSSFLGKTQPSAIISLNLLSQIPIGWQQLVERKLKKYFGCRWVDRHESQWLEALIPSAQALVKQHLRDLAHSGAKEILLFSDTEYFLFHGNEKEQVNALYGIDLRKEENIKEFFSNHSIKVLDKWLWHIAPIGLESACQGSSHEIICYRIKQAL